MSIRSPNSARARPTANSREWRGNASLFAAVLLLVLAVTNASPAAEQAGDPELTPLVETWLDTATGYDPRTIAFAEGCLVEELLALPDNARQTIVEAGAFVAGLTALADDNAEAWDMLRPRLDGCIETMDLGDQIIDWVNAERSDVTRPERNEMAFCVMTTVSPLHSLAKEIIFLAGEFGVGIEVLIATDPVHAADIDVRIASCM